MGININWYRALPEQEKQSCRNKLENEHRVAQKLLEQAKKVYATCVEEVKASTADIATVIRHLEKCKEEIKELEDDMGKISAYSKNYSYGGTTTTLPEPCDDRDPYVALTSILGNGFVHIRPGELCQHLAAGTQTYQDLLDDLQNETEANEMHKWSTRQGQFQRSTKAEEPSQQKDREQLQQREQQKEPREPKAKG